MKKTLILLLLSSLLLSGCQTMNIEDFSNREPKLILEDYFSGTVYAWGIFEDRFGNLRREFQVEIHSEHVDGVLTLDEYFLYADGEKDRRIWRITKKDEQRYEGTAGDIVGVAEGVIAGNALNWTYQMDLMIGERSWRVTFDDWMYLQPNGVLMNRASVSKWGIELGQVTLSFMPASLLQEAPFNLKDNHDL